MLIFRNLVCFGLSVVFCLAVSAQDGKPETTSCPEAKRFVDSFWRAEKSGKHLTPEGKAESDNLFVSQTPRHPTGVSAALNEPGRIWVISQNSMPEEDLKSHGCDRIHFWVEFLKYGSIDQQLKFREAVDNIGGVRIGAWSESLDVVRTESGNFKLLEPFGVRIDVPSAIRYVQRQRARTNDPLIKTNGDKTLVRLRELIARDKKLQESRKNAAESFEKTQSLRKPSNSHH